MNTTTTAPPPADRDWDSTATTDTFEAVRQRALAHCADLIVLQQSVVQRAKDIIDAYEQSQDANGRLTATTYTADQVVDLLAAQYLADRIDIPDSPLSGFFDRRDTSWDQMLEGFGHLIALHAEAIRIARSRLASLGTR